MEDKVIVDSILRSGRTQLFSLIVKKYGSAVYAKALAIIKDAEEAKEIAQQTFVKAYQQLEDWQGTQLGPWLVAIACHLSLNALEKVKRKHNVDAEQVQIPDETYSEEREERLQRMEQAISELPPQDQQIIRLYYYNKVKTEDIAQALHLSQSNILVRLHRIRERLKKQLQNEKD
ncbi:MAG: sigma-70 family RNA polymerase sigma factor [Bacteroidaceae bacterium]|nr:sigma-70 family RNA polymerase sigma factor [Bacteroidaceae bacterium]